MRNRITTILLLVVLGTVGLLALNRYAAAKPSTTEETKRKWEYCHVFASYPTENNHYKAPIESASTPVGRFDEIDSNYGGLAALNKLGADGWELVAILPSNGNGPEYILKRPKP